MSKVLVVEDNVGLCALYSRILSQIDADVTLAHRCRAALDYLKNTTPDLVLLDMGLPDGSGQMVVDYIKEHLSDSAPYIIVITGNEYNRDADLVAAVDQVLLKPVSPVVLLDAIRQSRPARAA